MSSDTLFLSFHESLLEQTSVFRGNALLLTGPAHVGKRALAFAIAAQHNCSGRHGMYGEACGRCPSCVAIANNTHPDILWIEPRTKTSTGKTARRKIIPIGAILEHRDDQKEFEVHVYEFLEVRPTFKRRVVMVRGVEYLGQEAANALLKLIEEPPHGALFIFLTEDVRAVLPTIQSRSARLVVPPVADERLLAQLEQENPELIEFASGRPTVLDQAEEVQAALQDAKRLDDALEAGPLSALQQAEALEKAWGPWHPEALRFQWRYRPVKERALADSALQDLQKAFEAYANSSLSFQVFALELRRAFGCA